MWMCIWIFIYLCLTCCVFVCCVLVTRRNSLHVWFWYHYIKYYLNLLNKIIQFKIQSKHRLKKYPDKHIRVLDFKICFIIHLIWWMDRHTRLDLNNITRCTNPGLDGLSCGENHYCYRIVLVFWWTNQIFYF